MKQFYSNFLRTRGGNVKSNSQRLKKLWILAGVIGLSLINNNLDAQSFSLAASANLDASENKRDGFTFGSLDNRSIDKKDTNYYIDKTVSNSQLLIDEINSTAGENSFHLFAHGRPGELLINGKWLNAQKIAVFIEQQLSINNYQSSINIYGCEFAKGEKGKQAIAYLKETLGASIAASDDITGKDGDWDLEVFTGTVQPQTLALNNWEGNLQDTDGDGVDNVNDLDDDNDGILDTNEGLCGIPINYEWVDDPSQNSALLLNPITFGSTTFNLSISGLLGNSIEYPDETNGGYSGWRIIHDGQANNEPITATIDFANPIDNLSFSIGDLDEGTTNSGKRERAVINIILSSGDTYVLQSEDLTLGTGVVYLGNNIFVSSGSGTPPDPRQTLEISTSVADIDRIEVTIDIEDGTANNGYIMIGDLFACEDVDSDNDGIPDYLDTDSDNDGCADADEAYGNINTDSNNDGTYGGVVSSSGVDTDGKVTGASYTTGAVAAVTDASASICKTESCNYSKVSDGIEALYLFEGNTNDYSGNGHSPENTPNITYTTDALEGSNSGQYNTGGLQLNDGIFLTAAFRHKTLSMFIKPDNLTTEQVLYDEGDHQNGISLRLTSGGNLSLSVVEGGTSREAIFPFPTDGEWHHIGFVYNGTTGVDVVTLYLDGMPVDYVQAFLQLSNHNTSGGLLQSFNRSADGGTGGRAYIGLIDDVAIYNSALTPKNMLDIADCAGTDYPVLSCEATGYLVRAADSQWTSYDFIRGEYAASDDDVPNRINAMGYNVTDNRIWGYYNGGGSFASYSEGELTITTYDENSGTYVTIITPPIVGLPHETYIVGDVDANGVLYLFYNKGSKIHKVDVNPASANYMTYIGAQNLIRSDINVSDFAFHSNGLIYAVVNEEASVWPGRLISINPSTGTITSYGPSGIDSGASVPDVFGATYIDGDGYMYVLSNKTGKIYRLDLTTPPVGNTYDEDNNTALFLTSFPSGSNDGAMCLNAVVALDFGDAPESYGTLLEVGPRHGIFLYDDVNHTSPLMLGTKIDREGDGIPATTGDDAAGDDSDGIDDEDGIAWPDSLIPGTTYNETITVTNTTEAPAYLNVWIDYNRDGDFLDTDEQLLTNQEVASGAPGTTISVPLSFTVPLTALEGDIYARVRLCDGTEDCDEPTGTASAGEIEDYRVRIAGIADLELTKEVDEDNPSVGSTIIFTLTLTNNGPSNATDITVKDLLPSGLAYDESSSTIPPGTTYDSGSGTWDLSELIIDNGDSIVLKIAATVGSACGPITNTAEIITSSRPDPDSKPGNEQ